MKEIAFRVKMVETRFRHGWRWRRCRRRLRTADAVGASIKHNPKRWPLAAVQALGKCRTPPAAGLVSKRA